jgi:hypothetical protein
VCVAFSSSALAFIPVTAAFLVPFRLTYRELAHASPAESAKTNFKTYLHIHTTFALL